MTAFAQTYVLQIAAFVMTNAGAMILGKGLFTRIRALRWIAGGGCLLAAGVIFYVTRPL